MDKLFPTWYSKVNIEPTPEILQLRWQGITEITESFTDLDKINELVRMFFHLSIDEEFKTELNDIFFKHDPTFSIKNNTFELSVLAGVILYLIAISDSEEIKIYTILAVLSCSFNQKAAVQDIFNKISEYYYSTCSETRNFENIIALKMTNPNFSTVIKSLDTAKPTNVLPAAELLESLPTLFRSLQKSITQIQTKLQFLNIYREDSQILWWMTANQSLFYNKSFKDLGFPQAALIMGRELSDFITVLPGPYSAHAVLQNIIVNMSIDKIEKYSIAEFINSIDLKWKQDYINSDDLQVIHNITPLHNAISFSLQVDKANQWYPLFLKSTKIKAGTIKKEPIDISFQFYIESLMIKAYNMS